jgi:P27 family predicted phage terminase small subunit
MARPPKPTALHTLQGTRPSNSRDREPTPAVGAERPAHVIGLARAKWVELADVLTRTRILTEADAEWLGMTCVAYADWRAADRVVRRRGMTYLTTSDRGAEREIERPEVRIRNDAWRRYTAGLAALGLNPSARARVAAQPEEQRDPLAEFRTG